MKFVNKLIIFTTFENLAPMRPVSSRPVSSRPNIRTNSRTSYPDEMSTSTPSRRPKTTHVSSGRRRWRSPPNVNENHYETQDFEENSAPTPARPSSSRPARIQNHR